VARVVRRRRVPVVLRVAEVLRLAVRLLGLLLWLLLPLLLRVRRRGRVVPVRRLLRSMLLRGAVVPAASVPESSHVIERTRFRAALAPLRLTCDIP
jgi:hypothetical protein